MSQLDFAPTLFSGHSFAQLVSVFLMVLLLLLLIELEPRDILEYLGSHILIPELGPIPGEAYLVTLIPLPQPPVVLAIELGLRYYFNPVLKHRLSQQQAVEQPGELLLRPPIISRGGREPRKTLVDGWTFKILEEIRTNSFI